MSELEKFELVNKCETDLELSEVEQENVMVKKWQVLFFM